MSVSLLLGGWSLSGQVEVRERLSRVEALNVQQLGREIIELRAELATLPKEVPPAWFVDRVKRIETILGDIDKRVRAIERDMARAAR